MWGIQSDVSGGGEGPYELQPSRGWMCLVENNIFLKPREDHSGILISFFYNFIYVMPFFTYLSIAYMNIPF